MLPQLFPEIRNSRYKYFIKFVSEREARQENYKLISDIISESDLYTAEGLILFEGNLGGNY